MSFRSGMTRFQLMVPLTLPEQLIAQLNCFKNTAGQSASPRHDMCPIFYTPGFSGPRFYTGKQRNLRRFSFTI